MSATLVILAADTGSRCNGLKQLAPAGPHGETLTDYTVHDAVRAGSERAVFVIRPELEAAAARGRGNASGGALLHLARTAAPGRPSAGSRRAAGAHQAPAHPAPGLGSPGRAARALGPGNRGCFYGAATLAARGKFLAAAGYAAGRRASRPRLLPVRRRWRAGVPRGDGWT